jgi:hypothetical protein
VCAREGERQTDSLRGEIKRARERGIEIAREKKRERE